MSIQSKISGSQILVKRRLRDYSVFINGSEIEIIRLKIVENQYGDETVSVIDHDKITIVLDIPDGIPLDRLRDPTTGQIDTTQSIFLYDILPIEGYAEFADKVEKGDILIRKIYDELEDEPFLWILRVSEILGSIVHDRLTGRHFQCAPHNLSLTTEIQDIIDNY